MATRSLQASAKGIEKAHFALGRYALNQNALAKDLGLSRQTVNKFFKGKPIDRENFALICDRLGLELEDVVVTTVAATENTVQVSDEALDVLAQTVRQKVAPDIQERCGTMRVLDMTQAIGLDAIYTTVNIFEQVAGRQRRRIADLLEGCNLEELISLGQVKEERVPGLEAVARHSKLMILGKPGAGKTTFLKWIAIQCNNGQSRAEKVPVFIILKAFAETNGQPDLLTYIVKQWSDCGVKDTQAAETLLSQGRVLVLLDGLDEVRDIDHDRVLQSIQDFSTRFRSCQFVMTCRIAAREYTFERFTEVEVADFDKQQIADFVTKWFTAKQDPVKTERFLDKLRGNARIKELATNPLLLTLLCLVFQEASDFPTNRSELYREGLDVLLKKWDAKRNIERDALHQRSEIYQSLSLQRKEALLSHVAFTTFERGDLFFKQQAVEHYIAEFIRNLPGISDDPESLELDSEAILKSIEAQHGLLVERARNIYSFSHLTFQEYFTAKKITSSPAAQALEALQNLAIHVAEKRWQEVFLLTAGILQPADDLVLLMKAQIDQLVAEDKKLQQFLHWANEKASSVKTSYKPTAVRAFYISLALASASAFASTSVLTSVKNFVSISDLSSTLSSTSDLSSASTRAGTLARDLASELSSALARTPPFVSTFNSVFSGILKRTLDSASARNIVSHFNTGVGISTLTIASALASTLASDLASTRNRASSIVSVFARNLTSDLVSANLFARPPASSIVSVFARNLTSDLVSALQATSNLELRQALQLLKNQLPDPEDEQEAATQWWHDHGHNWSEELRTVMLQHRDIGHDWQFSPYQATLLKQYVTANKLLMDCLRSCL